MAKFVIHIGPHKTGTTYLQLGFRALRAELAAHGTIFPEFWELAPGNPSHLKLTLQLRDGNNTDLAPRFAELLATGADRVLLSSEDLSNLDTPALEKLRALIGANEVELVFYIRRWSELIPSSWQESIKQGQCHTFPEFVLVHLQRAEMSRLLNFDMKLAKFTEIFGADKLRLVGFCEVRERGLDMFQHFAANFLDWPDAPVPKLPPRANSSRDHKEAELLRALNAMARAHGATPADNLRKTFDRMRRTIDTTLLYPAMDRHTAKMRLNESLPSLVRLHDALAEKYLPHMVPPRLPAKLFRPRNPELHYVSPDYLAEPGAATALRQAYDKIRPEMETALQALQVERLEVE